MSASTATGDRAGKDTSFFGHPRGLATLFFTEMWERWGYYGMRALLILFMTASVADGGLGFDIVRASAIYGMFTTMVYLMTVPGGWIADRIIGQRRAVLLGGLIMTAGYFLIAAPGAATFYLGLVLVVTGTGLLKANISTIVGQLYGPQDPRRDSGYSIFYMGINLGGLLAPIACGWIASRYGWRAGMAVAGVGMALGLLQYLLSSSTLGEAGLRPVQTSPEDAAKQKGLLRTALIIVGVVALALFLADSSGVVAITAERLSTIAGWFLAALVVGLFGWMLSAPWSPVERKRIYAMIVLFLAASVYWSLSEQAGSTLNLFADRNTDNRILGYEYPASWLQSVNSIFIVAFAPVFAWIWIRLGKRDPSSAVKFALALLTVGASFIVLMVAATMTTGGAKVSPMWLVTTYFLTTVGELMLSPVGLSAFSKLAPARVTGLMMGIWFLTISVGNFMGGRVAALYESLPLTSLFGAVGGFAIVTGILLAFLVKPLNRLTEE